MKHNMTSVRDLLEQMSTEQLDEMLDKELHAEPVDGNAIRLILGVLREREKDMPVEITPEIQTAWEKYQKDTARIWEHAFRTRRVRNWVIRAASAAAVLVIFFVSIVPRQAGADSVWDRLVRWTADVVEFFSPNDNGGRLVEYEFKSENPGLQQVYEAVVQLGVTEPVVPMWLPEAELIECTVEDANVRKYVYSRFDTPSGEITFEISVSDEEVSHKYIKDENWVGEKEINGIKHNIIRNNDLWVVLWTKENIECSIYIDCQEDTLYKILKSIYVTEDE